MKASRLFGWRSQLRRQAYEIPLDARGEARRIRIDEMNRSLSLAELRQPWMRGWDALKPENYIREGFTILAKWRARQKYVANTKDSGLKAEEENKSN